MPAFATEEQASPAAGECVTAYYQNYRHSYQRGLAGAKEAEDLALEASFKAAWCRTSHLVAAASSSRADMASAGPLALLASAHKASEASYPSCLRLVAANLPCTLRIHLERLAAGAATVVYHGCHAIASLDHSCVFGGDLKRQTAIPAQPLLVQFVRPKTERGTDSPGQERR